MTTHPNAAEKMAERWKLSEFNIDYQYQTKIIIESLIYIVNY